MAGERHRQSCSAHGPCWGIRWTRKRGLAWRLRSQRRSEHACSLHIYVSGPGVGVGVGPGKTQLEGHPGGLCLFCTDTNRLRLLSWSCLKGFLSHQWCFQLNRSSLGSYLKFNFKKKKDTVFNSVQQLIYNLNRNFQ